MYPFGFNWIWHLHFAFLDFFFFLRVNSNITWFYYVGDKKHCTCTVHVLFTGSTTLFTHLKIILLQCFQFSISVKMSSIQTNPIYIYIYIYIAESPSRSQFCILANKFFSTLPNKLYYISVSFKCYLFGFSSSTHFLSPTLSLSPF